MCPTSCTYLFGFRGDTSIAGPGAGMSIGNMSTHISMRPLPRTTGKKIERSVQRSFIRSWQKRGSFLPVRCRVCRGSARVWSPRVQGRACSPPAGSPPSGSALSEPDAPQSASSDLRHGHKQKKKIIYRIHMLRTRGAGILSQSPFYSTLITALKCLCN